MNYLDAKAKCESESAYLASPRSDDENAFIASLIPNENILIGVNDIDEEGTFVTTDGRAVSYTNWKTNQPDNYGSGEDVVVILGNPNGFWGDGSLTHQSKFVCVYNIKDDNAGKSATQIKLLSR